MEDTTLFIPLTRESMRKAIARSRSKRPHVKILNIETRTYSVTSSRGAERYTCQLGHAQGRLLGRCECPAGERGVVCYHLAAAAGVATGIKKMRQLAEEKAMDERHGIRREGRRAFINGLEI
jgi:uncharacterized Zn finger protein